MYEETENRLTVQVTACHSSIKELIKPAEKVIGSIIDLCKEATANIKDARDPCEKLEIYESLRYQLDELDKR